MKIKDLEVGVRDELKQEHIAEKKELLKERIREIGDAEAVLKELKDQLNTLLEQEV